MTSRSNWPAGRVWSRYARHRRGNVAMIAAFSAPVLAVLTFGVIDISRAANVRTTLQDGLDAAALAVARAGGVDADRLQALGQRVLEANMKANGPAVLAGSEFILTDGGREVRASAEMNVPSSIMGLFDGNKLSIRVESKVRRSAQNLEVALVLDNTGSMAGSRIAHLRDAATELVDIVVHEEQQPFYSKVAIVPYAMSVNLGESAEAVRGPVRAGKAITNIVRGDPVEITAPQHGFRNGDRVYITDVSGTRELNDREFVVSRATADTFSVGGVNGADLRKYNGGGLAHCLEAGCQYVGFNNAASGARRIHEISDCVTERVGGRAYTDEPPSTEFLGRNYPSESNACESASVQPLSDDRRTLHKKIKRLVAVGSTGGHIGVGWGWYMVSPNFGYLWPTTSRPAAYRQTGLIKAVVIMTDGEYNSAYCKGVISKDSTRGSGSPADHIDCKAENGHSFTQAGELCSAMKSQGVLVYTVGFDIVDDDRARALVNNCASSPKHVHLASSGADLKLAFREIAHDLAKIRIAE